MEEMSWVFKVLSYHIPKGTEGKPQKLVRAACQHAKIQTWDRQNMKQECQKPNQILDYSNLESPKYEAGVPTTQPNP
jgi:hypothetical protein